MRVVRRDTGIAWAESPCRTPATGHLIGNLEVAPLENGELQAKTAFLACRSHQEMGNSEIDHVGR